MFFFFKQKTADDVRISDWSSDVCSSDLADMPGDRRHVVFAHQEAVEDAAMEGCVVQALLEVRGPALFAHRPAPEVQRPSPQRGAGPARSEERRVRKECEDG